MTTKAKAAAAKTKTVKAPKKTVAPKTEKAKKAPKAKTELQVCGSCGWTGQADAGEIECPACHRNDLDFADAPQAPAPKAKKAKAPKKAKAEKQIETAVNASLADMGELPTIDTTESQDSMDDIRSDRQLAAEADARLVAAAAVDMVRQDGDMVTAGGNTRLQCENMLTVDQDAPEGAQQPQGEAMATAPDAMPQATADAPQDAPQAPSTAAQADAVKAMPKNGDLLVRDWNGRRLEVKVIHGGFIFEGRHYGSLSKIAKEVTQQSRSGPEFFGLVKQPRPAKGERDGAAEADLATAVRYFQAFAQLEGLQQLEADAMGSTDATVRAGVAKQMNDVAAKMRAVAATLQRSAKLFG